MDRYISEYHQRGVNHSRTNTFVPSCMLQPPCFDIPEAACNEGASWVHTSELCTELCALEERT